MGRKPKLDKVLQKQIRRNRDFGLIPKCFKYGQLKGVELALIIKYPEQDGIFSYCSEDLAWLDNITDMMKHPKSKNLTPDDVRNDKGIPKSKKRCENMSETDGPEYSTKRNSFKIPEVPRFRITMLEEYNLTAGLSAIN